MAEEGLVMVAEEDLVMVDSLLILHSPAPTVTVAVVSTEPEGDKIVGQSYRFHGIWWG